MDPNRPLQLLNIIDGETIIEPNRIFPALASWLVVPLDRTKSWTWYNFKSVNNMEYFKK